MDLFGDLPPPSEDDGKRKTKQALFGDLPPPEGACNTAAGQKRNSRDPLDAEAPAPKAKTFSGVLLTF